VTVARPNDRSEAVLLVGALGAAALTFPRWGLVPVLAAALIAGAIGLRRGLPLPLSLAAAAAAGAALVHFAAAPEHFREWWGFGTFFVLCGEAQLGWAFLARRRPGPLVLSAGLAGSLLLVALWLVSRTVGLPFGPEPGVPEAAGPADLVAVSLELATALACGRSLVAGAGRAVWALPARAAVLLATAGLTAWALVSPNAG
jgi:hypothetical protein